MVYDYIIIGSGISGVASAKVLLEKGKKVKILETRSVTGGLVHCERSSGHLYHRVGGHVFNSKNQEVLDWFWSYFDKEKEFIPAKRNAQIWMNDQFLGYPLENYLYKLPQAITEKVIDELLELSKQAVKQPEDYDNFEAFLEGNFGQTLYDIYFHPYNQKIWQYDLSKVPMAWLEGKLPMPNYRDIILQNILQKEESEMVHSSFYYPKKGGSQFIIDRLAEGIDISCNVSVENLDFIDHIWTINGSMKAKHIVFTGDVRKLKDILSYQFLEVKSVLKDLQHLPSHGTSNLLCECDKTDLSWLYIPEKQFKTHRIIYTGNFSRTNNSESDSERISCTVEFSGIQDWQTMTAEIGKLPGNLVPLDFNNEQNSYVIHTKNTKPTITKLKLMLKDYNFTLLGRFAEWEYYNMDKAIQAAMELSQELEN